MNEPCIQASGGPQLPAYRPQATRPAEAYETLPGCALAYAMNSGIVLASEARLKNSELREVRLPDAVIRVRSA
jgi:hypothetical protein